MKKILLSVIVLGALTANAQIVNPDFETWTGMDPDGWDTFNGVTQLGADPTTYQETNNPAEGSSSVRLVTGECATCIGFGLPTEIPGFVSQTIAINYRPDSVFFLVKTGSAIGGAYLIDFTLSNQGDSVGALQIASQQIIPIWSPQAIAITYFAQSIPDTLAVIFASGSGLFGGPADVIGDSLFIDMVSVSDPAGNNAIDEVNMSSLNVYPTMATEMVTFEMEKTGVVIVDIYDALGKVVASELVKTNSLKLNVSNFQAGLYIYQVRDLRNQVIESGKFTKQ
jgi:hypothetical protein